MPESGDFNQLERDIANLEQVLASKRQVLEEQKQNGEINKLPQEKEILHEIIAEKIQLTPNPTVSPPARISPDGDDKQPAPAVEPPAYLSVELKDQVQVLVNLAFTKSIAEAIKVVRASGNAAIIDAFHDALTDELYNQLLKRGKLRKI